MTMIFEVRVEGQLAGPTLHSLGCAHSFAPARTSMRVEATPSDLNRLLEECSDRGLTIESVVRIDGVSTSRARAPDVPRRPAG